MTDSAKNDKGKLCGRIVYLAPDGTEHELFESRTKPKDKPAEDK